MGASVQIALDKSRTGTYREIAAMGSNLILERAGRVFKWPKCKSRLIHDDSTDRFDTTIIPSEEGGCDNVNKNEASSSSQTQIQSDLDAISVPPDPLRSSELPETEACYESDMVGKNVHFVMFSPKGNHFRIHPETTLQSTTQIIRPEHFARESFGLKPLPPPPPVFSHESSFPLAKYLHDSREVRGGGSAK